MRFARPGKAAERTAESWKESGYSDRQEIPFHVIAVLTNLSLDYPDEIFEFYVNHDISQVAFNIEEIEGPHQSSSLEAGGIRERFAGSCPVFRLGGQFGLAGAGAANLTGRPRFFKGSVRTSRERKRQSRWRLSASITLGISARFRPNCSGCRVRIMAISPWETWRRTLARSADNPQVPGDSRRHSRWGSRGVGTNVPIFRFVAGARRSTNISRTDHLSRPRRCSAG